MGAASGLLASRRLARRVLARRMQALSAWLNRTADAMTAEPKAATASHPPATDDPLDALRRRYPDAPEPWLRAIADRLGPRALPAGVKRMPADIVAAMSPELSSDPLAWMLSAVAAPDAPPLVLGTVLTEMRATDPGTPGSTRAADCSAVPPHRLAPRSPMPLPQPLFAAAWDTALPAPNPYAPSPRAAPLTPRFARPQTVPPTSPQSAPPSSSADESRPPVPQVAAGAPLVFGPAASPSPAPGPAWSLAAPRPPVAPLALVWPLPGIGDPLSFAPPRPRGPVGPPAPAAATAPGPDRDASPFADHVSDISGVPAPPDWPAAATPRTTVPASFARPDDADLWPALPSDDDPLAAPPDAAPSGAALREAATPPRWAAPRPDQEARIWNG
jgi:hypothetical protein